jgi:transposase
MPSLSRQISPPVNTCEGPGSITAPILVSSQQHYGIEVIGPARPDVKWQANSEDGIAVSQFRIAWHQQQATCPQGHTSISWTPAIDHRKNEVIKIKCSRHRLRQLSSADPLYPLRKEVQTANHSGTTAGPA